MPNEAANAGAVDSTMIVEIAGSGTLPDASSSYGFSIRFPRIVKFKNPADVTPDATSIAMYKSLGRASIVHNPSLESVSQSLDNILMSPPPSSERSQNHRLDVAASGYKVITEHSEFLRAAAGKRVFCDSSVQFDNQVLLWDSVAAAEGAYVVLDIAAADVIVCGSEFLQYQSQSQFVQLPSSWKGKTLVSETALQA
jgi:hypothetical protein